VNVTRCPHCDLLIWYPRERCPRCTRDGLDTVPLAGTGTVYTYTVNRRPGKGRDPVVIAYVELDEGPRVLTNLVGVAPDDVRIGLPVRAVHEDGIPRFTPVEVSNVH
jgi:uncharacterized protein